jgi:hypothetical protein
MRSRLVLAFTAVVLVPALAACDTAKTAKPAPVTPATLEVAGPDPSVSAKMICDEVKAEIAAAVGVDTTRPLAPKWANHVYSCVYVYGAGKQMTLSVKEMSSVPETTAYFDGLAARLHRTPQLIDLGEGGFSTRDGSIVVRKDFRVLLVDVSHLPARFGIPPMARSAFANAAAATIMSCWTGA